MTKSTEFEILEKIGQGGMGEVYRARLYNRHGVEKIVAAKKVLGSVADKTFLREAEILSKLNHPNICSFFDIKDFEGNTYLLMEYIEGTSFHQIQEIAIQKGYRFSEDFIFQTALQILKALEHAHSYNEKKPTILHRDISPQNIMTTNEGLIKILDFGIAKIGKAKSIDEVDSVSGKIRYCAPEVLCGEGHSIKSDLYALGVLLFELCVGSKAFDGFADKDVFAQKKESELNYDLLEKRQYSKFLQNFIQRISNSSQQNRFQTSKEAIEYIFMNKSLNLAKFNEAILLEELDNLRERNQEETKTISISIKPKKNKKIVVISVFIISLVFGFIGIRAYVSWGKKKPMKIIVDSENLEQSLLPFKASDSESNTPDPELRISDFVCLYEASSLLHFSKGILYLDNKTFGEKYLVKIEPTETLQSLIQWHEHNGYLVDFLNKNCSKSEFFLKAISLLDSYHESLSKIANKNYKTFEELHSDLQKSVYSREDDLLIVQRHLSSQGNVSDLLEKVKKANFYVDAIPGFMTVSLDEKLFPKSQSECRDLLDAITLESAKKQSFDASMLSNNNVILLPYPLNATIVDFGPNFVKYREKTNGNASSFRKYGICVLRRSGGMVVESTFRKL